MQCVPRCTLCHLRGGLTMRPPCVTQVLQHPFCSEALQEVLTLTLP